MMGKSESIITQLLAFNIGLELGQLLIVLVVLMVSFIFVRLLNVKQREWTVFVSGGIFGISFIMALERLPF
jgi:HupE / UreJ protein